MEIPLTPKTLIQRLRGSEDRADWDEFFRLYGPVLRAYVRRFGLREHDADDLAQELFLKLRAQIPHFELDSAKGRFRAWLRTVVDNSVRDWLRQAGREAAPLHPDPIGPDGGRLDATEAGERWRRVEWRQAVLAAVMERVRQEFVGREKTLACFEQLTLQGRQAKEVAAELGIEKVNNVYVYSHRVLQRVRELCREYDEDLDEVPEREE